MQGELQGNKIDSKGYSRLRKLMVISVPIRVMMHVPSNVPLCMYRWAKQGSCSNPCRISLLQFHYTAMQLLGFCVKQNVDGIFCTENKEI